MLAYSQSNACCRRAHQPEPIVSGDKRFSLAFCEARGLTQDVRFVTLPLLSAYPLGPWSGQGGKVEYNAGLHRPAERCLGSDDI